MTESRPLLLLDVGFACTGVAVATLHDDGPHVALDVIVPTQGLSPKALHEKRACVKLGDLAERLFEKLVLQIIGLDPEFDDNTKASDKAIVVAEIPVMGSRSAAGMRSMALALACYRGACFATTHMRHDFTRNDVLAACWPDKKNRPVGDAKVATYKLVNDLLVVDASRLVKPKSKADEQVNLNAYDAAALLFVAREHGILKQCGWGDWRSNPA